MKSALYPLGLYGRVLGKNDFAQHCSVFVKVISALCHGQLKVRASRRLFQSVKPYHI